MEMIRRSVGSWLLAALAVTALPSAALACPVCFTASDTPIVNGVSMAILALLGVTGVVLACFGAFFIGLVRRSRAVQDLPALVRPIEQGGHN